ncbi:MAG: DNA replication/repair protein RecF [Firmicutes bacterium]|nr:DNA replication/repair protein RecF [Bacillota bacterium]
MYIKNIELHNFRNYGDLELEFHPNVNLILGNNAQGKTNLLESIYVCSMGKSFRTSKDSEMILFGEDFGRVRVEAQRDYYDTSVELIFTRDSKKSAKVDGVKIKKSSQLLENLYMVIFSPEDLRIVKDEPEKRRKFIDRELCQLRPKYYEDLSNYKKVLLQRNAYLKEYDVDPSVMDLWDMQLARYGASIMMMRADFIKKLDKISRGIHGAITNGGENLQLKYVPNVELAPSLSELEERYYHILRSTFENDLRQRTTTKGPHKDDLEFFIDGISVRNFGSQGQQRTSALSIKLAELSLIKEETGEEAILLLDDVMSELDLQRQEFLVKSLAEIQMFITTTEIPEKLKETLPEGKTFYVISGSVEEE